MHTLHREAAALIEQQAATIAELREVLEMTTRCIEIVNKTMAEQGFGQSNSLVAVAQIGRATLERRGQ
jgi:phage anti-repressor protein